VSKIGSDVRWDPRVPFIDHSKQIDEKAKDWVGNWGPGEWNLFKDLDGGFKVTCGTISSDLSILTSCSYFSTFYDEGRRLI